MPENDNSARKNSLRRRLWTDGLQRSEIQPFKAVGLGRNPIRVEGNTVVWRKYGIQRTITPRDCLDHNRVARGHQPLRRWVGQHLSFCVSVPGGTALDGLWSAASTAAPAGALSALCVVPHAPRFGGV